LEGMGGSDVGSMLNFGGHAHGIKESLPYGYFQLWHAAEYKGRIPLTTLEEYMRAASLWNAYEKTGRTTKFVNLGRTSWYLLCRKGVPQESAFEILELANEKVIPLSDV